MNYTHPLYTLQLDEQKRSFELNMQVSPSILYTSSFPKITEFLRENSPRVLRTKCFNPQKLTFAKEVLDTELAHLFEHVFIQNLCDESIAAGKDHACFRADTEWDWTKNPRGTFTIKVYTPIEKKLLQPALQNTISLTDKLLTTVH